MPLPSIDRPVEQTPAASQFPPTGRVTLLLMVACVAVFLWTGMGADGQRLLLLLISLSPFSSPEALSEVRGGELWRLFTPTFIHFGVPHLLVNMLGLQSIGSAVEEQGGRRFYLVLIAVLALITNLAEYVAAGPYFGGMSGVLYGLFGYIWLRSVCDPGSGFYIPRQTIVIALVLLLACCTGLLGPIGNAAHLTGLALGALWGAVTGRQAARSSRDQPREGWRR